MRKNNKIYATSTCCDYDKEQKFQLIKTFEEKDTPKEQKYIYSNNTVNHLIENKSMFGDNKKEIRKVAFLTTLESVGFFISWIILCLL